MDTVSHSLKIPVEELGTTLHMKTNKGQIVLETYWMGGGSHMGLKAVVPNLWFPAWQWVKKNSVRFYISSVP